MINLQTLCDVTNQVRQLETFPLQQMSVLQVLDSAHPTFCTVKLKPPTEGTINKKHFLVKGDLK